ncbi:MAG: NFACT family protein [Theionarchaea archaeon]|nr:NFACT family protein [Theionarchaea archaeon]
MSFSSFDVYEMVKELQDIVGMGVNIVYQIGSDIRIKLFGKGRKDLVITNEAFYITRYPRKAPQKPTGFAMQIRKYVKGTFLYQINQVNFDRIVEFGFGYNNEILYTIVGELFGKGNIILRDQDEIIGVLRKEKWRDRILYPHQPYKYPPSRLSIDIPFEEFVKLNIETEKDLAVTFNFGKLYAREIFLRSKSESAKDLYEAMHSFEKKANIANTDVVPYDLLAYKEYEKKYFPSFTEAVDEFYKPVIQEIETEEDRILHSQEEALKEFEARKEEYATCGNLIYENYGLVHNILQTLLDARKKYEWEDIVKTIKESTNESAQKIVNLDYRTGKVVVDLGIPVVFDLKKNINENAASYYEMAKKMDKKITGAKKAMKRMKLKERKKPKLEIKVLRKREWYEKFHWCFSSEGFLILGGRDVKTNELLVKRYMEPQDIYVHADIQGAPSVIIKKGKSASDKTIEEACMVAATFSRAWNHFGSLECYWVNPDQVTKSPPSGEYLTPGAFFISGSKNVVKVQLELVLGVHEGKVMAGPESAIKAHTKSYVKIGFGDEKKERLAKHISNLLEYSDIDEIVRALPGTGRILGKG